MNIVIAGAGEVGTHLSKLLSEGSHSITVVDPSEERLRAVKSGTDVVTVQGSTTSLEVLEKAGIHKADLLIAVTPSEDTNIVTCMLGKKMGAGQTVARIDHNEYLDVENRRTFTHAGIDNMFYPEKIAASEIVNLLSQTSTSEYIEFANGKLVMMVFSLDDDAPIVGKTIAEATRHAKTLEYRVIAINRSEKTIIPHRFDAFEAGDQLYMMTTRSGMSEMLEFSGKENIEVHNMIILGGSRIGIKVATSLDRRLNIKIIEQQKERCVKLAEMFKNAMIINGDGRNADLLLEEGLQKTDAFVAVTGSSETNILACLLAKQMGVQRTIAEVENLDYIQLAESIGINTIINKKLITAGHIFRFTQNTNVQAMKYLTGSDAEALEFIAKTGCRASKAAIKDLELPANAIIGGIVRGGKGVIATGVTEVKAGDHVIVFALGVDAAVVGEFFR
ncbi:MAG: Trk system potassium transporter TrkA [Prevotellaceae bacterium]|jgi:trk system potassium uptake protein TrkA|nr:Trk system potassium transporter TrkA [Prevotellaceae bacterium]